MKKYTRSVPVEAFRIISISVDNDLNPLHPITLSGKKRHENVSVDKKWMEQNNVQWGGYIVFSPKIEYVPEYIFEKQFTEVGDYQGKNIEDTINELGETEMRSVIESLIFQSYNLNFKLKDLHNLLEEYDLPHAPFTCVDEDDLVDVDEEQDEDVDEDKKEMKTRKLYSSPPVFWNDPPPTCNHICSPTCDRTISRQQVLRIPHKLSKHLKGIQGAPTGDRGS